MSIARLIISISIYVFATAFANAEEPNAPLGLRWGETTAEVKASGVTLVAVPDRQYGSSFAATGLPAALADQDGAILSFDQDGHLWRLFIKGKGSDGDPTGYQVRRRYDELKSLLTEKYGRPHSVEKLGSSLYSQDKYFVSGIEAGQISWFSDFETDNVYLQLGVRANLLTDFYIMIYEYKPLREGFRKAKKVEEKNSL